MTPFNTDSWEQLEPTVQTLWRINGVISAVFCGIGVAIPEFIITRNLEGRYSLPPGVIALAAFVVVLVLNQIFIGKSYHAFRFKLGEDDLAVAKGVFWKNWKFISRNRVQHVDITAGPINRLLGIVQVSIYVGGMATAAAVIPGLTTARGEELRRRLVRDDTPPVPPAAPVAEQQPPAPPQDTRPLWEPPTSPPPPVAQPEPAPNDQEPPRV